ncbi:MAG: c-type cytochrome [Proteobacteria bacterium]|nr:c-type cytochrome [Pseudomonadota bacterium]
MRLLAGLAISTCVVVALWAAPAAAQNIDLGKSVYQTKVQCPLCHGWAGHGVHEDPRAPNGANLRETAMDAEALYVAVQCGLPGTSMPFFDRLAYTDDRCYGMTADAIGDMKPPPGQPVLIKREIDALVAYLMAKVVGRGEPSEEECVEFFGADNNRCTDFAAMGAGGAGGGDPAANH